MDRSERSDGMIGGTFVSPPFVYTCNVNGMSTTFTFHSLMSDFIASYAILVKATGDNPSTWGATFTSPANTVPPNRFNAEKGWSAWHSYPSYGAIRFDGNRSFYIKNSAWTMDQWIITNTNKHMTWKKNAPGDSDLWKEYDPGYSGTSYPLAPPTFP